MTPWLKDKSAPFIINNYNLQSTYTAHALLPISHSMHMTKVETWSIFLFAKSYCYLKENKQGEKLRNFTQSSWYFARNQENCGYTVKSRL